MVRPLVRVFSARTPLAVVGQAEDAIALHRLAVQQRQCRRGREGIERGHVIGLRLFFAALGHRFRIMQQFDLLQAAAIAK